MPLHPVVINSLGGEHTHTHSQTCTPMFLDKAILRNQAHAGHRLVLVWLKYLITMLNSSVNMMRLLLHEHFPLLVYSCGIVCACYMYLTCRRFSV